MPILLTNDEWNRIRKWTNTDKEDQEAARVRNYLAYLNEKSAEMTKSWPNSLENVNKRNEELRRARREAAENVNTRFYRRYVKRKKEERERMMYSARDTIFKNKDAPKLLLSAVVESAVLKEREEQLKFKQEVSGAYEREQERLNNETVFRKAKEWNEFQEEKQRRRFQVNKQHQKDLLDQINKMQEHSRKEMEEELCQQKLDIINSTKEMETIKKFEADFKEAEKQRIWKDNEQSRMETEQRRKEAAARDHMDDQLLEVLEKTQCRVESKRRATEKEIREEKLRILEAISKNVAVTTGERDAKEQASLEKAIKERNKAMEARHKATIEKIERQNREKREAREQFLRDEAQRLHKKQNELQWGLMNRFKNQEIYEEYKENQRKERERKIQEHREDILRQKKEVDDRNAKELADTRYFYGKLAEEKLREADNKLFTHAAALIEEAKNNGRPTLPIYKALNRYCKMYRLFPMPDLPKSLQEHFKHYKPWDGSVLDPDYTEPPPPAPGKTMEEQDEEAAEDDAAEEEKRDGLQSLVKAKPTAKPPESPKLKEAKTSPKPPPIDYTRQGRANGLQRKPKPPEEIVMPPITVVTYPCKNLGIVSSVPLKKDQCECVVVGEI